MTTTNLTTVTMAAVKHGWTVRRITMDHRDLKITLGENTVMVFVNSNGSVGHASIFHGEDGFGRIEGQDKTARIVGYLKEKGK